MDKYIGFDIDDKKTVACVLDDQRREAFTTIPSEMGMMQAFLKAQQAPGCRLHLAFEISGQAGYLYDQLLPLVHKICVVNPHKATWIYRTAKKNDRIDARKMAILLSIDELPSVHMPERRVRQWRQLILHRHRQVGKITQTKNRIRALLKSQGHRPPGPGSWWKHVHRAWMEGLARLDADLDNPWQFQLYHLLRELQFQQIQLAQQTERLDTYLKKHPGGALLMSIQGVGPRTAEAVLAYTDDIHRFDTNKQYASYFGLTPKLDESGMCRRLGHISKHGPSVVRWALCESSWRVIRYVPGMKAFFDRVCAGQKQRRKIAMVAVCRKLLCIMRAMLLSGEVFNEEYLKQFDLVA